MSNHLVWSQFYVNLHSKRWYAARFLQLFLDHSMYFEAAEGGNLMRTRYVRGGLTGRRREAVCVYKGVWTVTCRRGSAARSVCVRVCACAHMFGTVSLSFSQSVGLLLPRHGCSLHRCPPLACKSNISLSLCKL